jgi:hypothetical protein
MGLELPCTVLPSGSELFCDALCTAWHAAVARTWNRRWVQRLGSCEGWVQSAMLSEDSVTLLSIYSYFENNLEDFYFFYFYKTFIISIY